MLNLTRAIDRATGYVFVPPAGGAPIPEGTAKTETETAAAERGPSAASLASSSEAEAERPNAYGLMSSAMGPRVGLRSDVRDVQERWVDAREEWDAYEKAGWRREGEALRRAAAEVEKQQQQPQPQRKVNVRERK
jgi:hypothetical protein